MPRYKESCYHELKSLGILAATYKHAQDAFSTNKSLLEFCHLKLTTKMINLQTKTLCSIRQIAKNKFWQPFERGPYPTKDLEKSQFGLFFWNNGSSSIKIDITGAIRWRLSLHWEFSLSILKLYVKRAPEMSILLEELTLFIKW